MHLKPLRPSKVAEGVSIWTEPTQELPWAARDPSLQGKEGVSVFASTPDSTVRMDVWDTGFPLLDRIRRKRAAAVAGYYALKAPEEPKEPKKPFF